MDSSSKIDRYQSSSLGDNPSSEISRLSLRLRRMTGAFLAAMSGNMIWLFARDMTGRGWLWSYLQPTALASGLVLLSFAIWYLASPPQRLSQSNS